MPAILRYVTTREAADLLHVAPATLERWRWSKRGPAYRRFGGLIRYDQSELLSWAEAQRCTSTSDELRPAHDR